MSNNTTHISVPVKGMNTDVHPANLTEQGYDFALNATVEEVAGNGLPLLQNEASTIKAVDFPSGYKVIGVINIVEQDRKVLFLHNPTTGFGQIGEIKGKKDCDEQLTDNLNNTAYCDDCEGVYVPEQTPLEFQKLPPCATYTPIVTQSCFKFSVDNPVKAVYRLEECGIAVYFTDNRNPYRYIEFEYLNDDSSQGLKVKDKFKIVVGYTPDCNEPIYGTQVDCNKLLLDPVLEIPTLDLVDVTSGGSLKAGVYQFLVSYANENGDRRTPYFHATNPIPIKSRDITFDTDYVTDRAIQLKIEGISLTSPYEFYNVAVAKTINNVTSFEFVGTYPVTNKTVTYTGNEKSLRDLDVNDVFEPKVYYAKAKTVASSNDYLFWASLEETKKLNLQRAANKVKLYWQTIAVPENVYSDPRNVNKFRGYMRDEVYAFGIVFIYKNGEESPVFHIPGRIAKASDLEIVDNADVVKESNCIDCAEEPVQEAQVVPGALNNATPTPSNTSITLVEDNSVKGVACVPVAYSTTATTPVSVEGQTAPVVSAGDDQNVNFLGTISLSGSAVAGSGSISSTRWNQISGPSEVDIASRNTLNPSIDNYHSGTYVFELVVVDTAGFTVTDTVSIVVNIAANEAPTSDPGEDKIITLPTSESFLNGANSADEDVISNYTWSQVSGPNTATIVSPSAPYTAVKGLVEGTYVFKLIVTDGRGCSSEATTKIYVLADPGDKIPEPVKLLYPTNGSVTSDNDVVLDWEDAPYATSYDVYTKLDGGAYALAGNTTESNFQLLNLTPNKVFHWYVVPKNANGAATGCEAFYRTFATPVSEANTNCQQKKWQVYNTATLIGGEHKPYKECEETCWEYGEFAYWESIEKYPNNPDIWGELCNKPIRHHKFPDSVITHIHDNKDGLPAFTNNNIVFPIGVRVDHDSIKNALDSIVTDGIITQDDRLRIVGYRIVRGNRFQNKSVVAKGLLYDVNQYRRKWKGDYFDNQTIYFPNYPYNDLRPNQFVTDDFRNYDIHNKPQGADLPFTFSKRYTFHSPDTHFAEPSVGTTLKLETVEYGMSEGYFTKSKRQAKQKFLSNTAYFLAFTGGIIAALTKVTDKEVKEYTAKGSLASALGVASGTAMFLPYQSGTGAAVVGQSIIDTLINFGNAPAINTAHEVKTITTQGKVSDFYNPVYLAKKKPWLLPLWPLMTANLIANFLSTVLFEADIILNMFKALTPYRDWTIQYNSVGKYNAYKPVPNSGNKIRHIASHSYLKPENALLSEESRIPILGEMKRTIKINNWHRETALYLKYDGASVPNASTFSGITDDSRYTFDDARIGAKLDKRAYANISSYYASIKNFVPDQYGDMFNVEYIPTGTDVFKIGTNNTTCKTIYGGDTFINRFALKRKVPYFFADTFEMMNGIDFNFGDYPNIGVPRHYYDSTTGVATEFDELKDLLRMFTPEGVATFLGRPKSIRDGQTNKFFYQNGYIYLYHYGIPYFLVESDVNVDMRHAENSKERAFYPLQSDLDWWLQEENVRLREPEEFTYNATYSKQNKEHIFNTYPKGYEPGRDCRVNHPNRIIYSHGSNWLTYKANDFYDFPLSKGKLVGVNGIENDKVLVRSENTTQVFNAYVTMQAGTHNIQVGTGGMFQTKPQEYASTTLGYAGSQHNAILNTEFGHIWVDAKRGQVFNLQGGQLNEISKEGMRNWFKENLPFQILKDFPNMSVEDIDNAFKGIGVTLTFDKRFARFLLTKLDYKVLDKTITYDNNQKQFKKGTEVVNINDSRYFCNKSWTISYSFYMNAWVSFHSFTPNYYIDGIDYFASGLNDGSTLWFHNATNKSYQVVYGKVKPFTVQTVTKGDIFKNGINSIEYALDAIRYHNEYDSFFATDVTFNKAIVFNQNQNSGLLNLEYNNKKDLFELVSYPIANVDSTTIRVTNADGIWRFNQFYDIVTSRNSNMPLWINNCANTQKLLNNKALDYQMADLNKRRIRGEYCRVRLTNDLHTNHKLIFKWLINKSVKTYR
jgi:hypothetical protein